MQKYDVTQAWSVEQLRAAGYGTGPEYTKTGIVCGDCSDVWREIEGKPALQVRHASVEHVAFCAETSAANEAESRAERAAELATERYFEDRGYWEARGQEDYERRFLGLY